MIKKAKKWLWPLSGDQKIGLCIIGFGLSITHLLVNGNGIYILPATICGIGLAIFITGAQKKHNKSSDEWKPIDSLTNQKLADELRTECKKKRQREKSE